MRYDYLLLCFCNKCKKWRYDGYVVATLSGACFADFKFVSIELQDIDAMIKKIRAASLFLYYTLRWLALCPFLWCVQYYAAYLRSARNLRSRQNADILGRSQNDVVRYHRTTSGCIKAIAICPRLLAPLEGTTVEKKQPRLSCFGEQSADGITTTTNTVA